MNLDNLESLSKVYERDKTVIVVSSTCSHVSFVPTDSQTAMMRIKQPIVSDGKAPPPFRGAARLLVSKRQGVDTRG